MAWRGISRSQQPRVAIARGTTSNPEVVLADGPAAHIDGSVASDEAK